MGQSGVSYAKGYKAAGVACGLKKNGKMDLAYIVSDVPANAAGVFTKNIVKGHSLQWSRKQMQHGQKQAIAINSGCANACVGAEGERDADAYAQLLADVAKCSKSQVLIGSTGVIGYRLNLEKIKSGLETAAKAASENGGHDAAFAVMTTDTYEKEAQAAFTYLGKEVRVGGFAKGSGMIHPDMATMISVITTDMAISAACLHDALQSVVDKTYNRVSVDGDTSVCDKVLLMANGMAENIPVEEKNEGYTLFLAALTTVAEALSRMLAKDGEGATKLLEFRVSGAKDAENAHKMLNAVAKSPLVKTAFFGQDANWGRILTAMGYSGAEFDPERVDIFLGEIKVCQNGCALPFDEALALEVLKKDEVVVSIHLQDGTTNDRMWTCDFSYDYIKINGSYRT